MTLMLVLGAAAIRLATTLATRVVHDGGAWAEVGQWLVGIAAFVVFIAAAMLLSVSLSKPLSGPALDVIVERHDASIGLPPAPPTSMLEAVSRALRVTLLGLVVSTPILIALTLVEFFVPPAAVVTLPMKAVVSALVVAWDLLDYPLGLRGLGARDRVRWVATNVGACLGFGAVAFAFLLVPLAGLLVLPFGVAGAARLVADVDAGSKAPAA